MEVLDSCKSTLLYRSYRKNSSDLLLVLSKPLIGIKRMERFMDMLVMEKVYRRCEEELPKQCPYKRQNLSPAPTLPDLCTHADLHLKAFSHTS